MHKAAAIACALLCFAGAASAQVQPTPPPEKKKPPATSKEPAKKGTATRPVRKPLPSGRLQVHPSSKATPIINRHDGVRVATRRITAATFLTPLSPEPPRYGLYSYILLGSPPESLNSTRWRRYHKTIAAFLSMPDFREVIPYVPPERINLTFLPVMCFVSELPKDATDLFNFTPARLERHRSEHLEAGGISPHDIAGPYSRSNPAATACVLVGSYNYARAAALLSLFGTPHTDGPYIISATQPLSKADALPIQYLYQDLSSVPPEMVVLWVEAFIRQAREPEFWKTNTEEQIILHIRDAIAEAGGQLPDFSSAIKSTLATVTPPR